MTRAGVLTSVVMAGLTVAGVAAQRGPRIPPTGKIMPPCSTVTAIRSSATAVAVTLAPLGSIVVTSTGATLPLLRKKR